MPSLCLITVPGLEVSSDWRLVHDRLLDEFPEVTDVLATTMEATILIAYEEATLSDPSRWLDTVSETLLLRRRSWSAQRQVGPSKRAVGQSHPGRASTGGRSLELAK